MGIVSRIFGAGGGEQPAPERDERAAAPDGGYEVADVYRGLREQVLGLAGDRSFQADGAIALLMETGYPGAVVSLVAIADGTTSLYFSNGGGVIGAGTHDAVRAASARLLEAAAASAEQMAPAASCPLPALGQVRFHLLTAGGIRAAEAPEQDLGHNRHPLSPLFHLAHAVIAAVREHTPGGG